MAPITATFPSAPRGRRIYLAAILAIGAALAGVAASVAVVLGPHQRHPARPLVAALIAPALSALVGTAFAVREAAKTAQFRIEDDVLVLDRKRYPLAGATGVERDPLVMKGACRRWGNSGLAAIRGRYKSKRLGKFDAFLTDPDRAVVVRWADQAVAVSPADPEFFIYSVRKAAGLS